MNGLQLMFFRALRTSKVMKNCLKLTNWFDEFKGCGDEFINSGISFIGNRTNNVIQMLPENTIRVIDDQ